MVSKASDYYLLSASEFQLEENPLAGLARFLSPRVLLRNCIYPGFTSQINFEIDRTSHLDQEHFAAAGLSLGLLPLFFRA
jgi:hypothetical protein